MLANTIRRNIGMQNATRAFSSSTIADNDAVIVSFARTPLGTFGGSFASMTGPQLGSVAIAAAIERAGLKPDQIEEAYMGNVVSSGIGQAPTRQAVLGAGLPKSTVCTTVNKVCASGMKTVMLSAQSIMLGHRDVMLAGGFESMSNIPYYLPKARTGYRLGNGELVDGLVHDGLWDPYGNHHMGMCGEKCAEDYGFTRKDQDDFAIASYTRAARAVADGKFEKEITPVDVKSRRGVTTVSEDEEYKNIDLEKLPSLRAVFKPKDGTVTAANASPINDGAAAMIVMSGKMAKSLNMTPLAKILSFGDAEKEPIDFTTAPADAVEVALKNSGMTMDNIDYHEVNEAFSVVALANMKIMGLDHSRVNVNGGAVALGHPIGCSGGRIIGTLINVLEQNDATVGCASICNGGGGASAIIIERLS